MSTQEVPVPRWRRPLLAALLLIAGLAIAWLVLFTPSHRLGVVGLTLVAAGTGAAFAYLAFNSLSDNTRAAFAVFATVVALAIGATADLPRPFGGTSAASQASQIATASPTPPPPAPSEEPSPTKSASPEAPPLIATYQANSFDGPECEFFVVDRTDLAKLPDRDDLTMEWVYARGGATATRMSATVILEGNAERATVVSDIDTTKVIRHPPLDDPVELTKCPPGGGNGLPSRDFTIEFDGRDTGKVRALGDGTPFRVTPDSPERLGFMVTAQEPGVYEYKIEFSWLLAGKEGHLNVGRDTQSIRTVADSGLPQFVWEEGESAPILYN